MAEQTGTKVHVTANLSHLRVVLGIMEDENDLNTQDITKKPKIPLRDTDRLIPEMRGISLFCKIE